VVFYPGVRKYFEEMYHNNQKNGEWIEYGGDGSVFARTVYENGRVVSNINKREEGYKGRSKRLFFSYHEKVNSR